MSQGITPASDEYARISKNKTEIILHTSDKPLELNSKSIFQSENTLIYAENVAISGTLNLRGKKSFGLFCSRFTVNGVSIIDISGLPGEDQMPTTDKPGANGTDGKDSGTIWIYAQHVVQNTLKNLTILAHGGKGGKGGDTSAQEETGGTGGNGGNSGHIEVLYGSTPMEVNLDFPTLRKQLWPARALDFVNGYSCSALPQYIPDNEKAVLARYLSLHDALQNLDSSLDNPILTSTTVENTKQVLGQILRSTHAPPSAPESTISTLKKAWEQIEKIIVTYRRPDVDNILKSISSLLQSLKPESESELADVLVAVYYAVEDDRNEILQQVRSICRSEPGPGGIGGSSGSGGAAPGKRGESGKDSGGIQVTNLHLNGDVVDLTATHAFAFPDQCQMLLNRANQQFFTNTAASRQKASDMYRILMARLSFLDNLGESNSSPLSRSYDELENKLGVILNGLTEMNSVYSEAKSRFNRLLIGQGMFGHVAEWVPRLSFQYYQKSITDQLSFLEKQEKSTSRYEKALQDGNDLQSHIAENIEQLRSNKQAADDQVALLTGINGPLATTAYKIDNFSPELKTKRDILKQRISEIEFNYQFDPKLIIDGIGTLITAPFNLAGLNNLLQYGYKAYESTTNVQGINGKVNKNYIIHQLATCSDSLDSLSLALKSNKDNTIQLDDPGALKVLATAESIKKILNEFQNAIPKEQQKDIRELLDDYTETVLNRNNAVIEYNSSIQLLLDALQSQKYLVEQISKLGGQAVKIDPTLPAVVFWLRKMRDSLRLRLMQYLNYESRAIRYWGLFDDIPMSSPGPLMDYIALGNTQGELQTFFDNALEFYSSSRRVQWAPDANSRGLAYALSPEEVKVLKSPDNSGDYTVFVSIDPNKTTHLFRDWVDIRLQEVRAWLFGVEVTETDSFGRKLLSIQITHAGDESILNTQARKMQFDHDPVHVQFVYDSAKVASIDDVPGQSIFAHADLEHDFGIGGIPSVSSWAPLGPFTTWRLKISQKGNPSVKMDRLWAAYIEFRGSMRAPERRTRDWPLARL